MSQLSDAAPEADFLDAPRDRHLSALYAWWQTKRGARPMPCRADFDPSEFKKLLPNIFMYDVGPTPGAFSVRLIGERLREFIGQNVRGKPAGSTFDRDAASALIRILQLTVERRAPVFRTGSAYFSRDKRYKKFESCLLPLSADGETVSVILGAVQVTR
ncbi:MAG TPA: PAS domain-containing protein [Stellaceae bacterium]|nr:PAS domain-containing protein [Stellaceae bacterium]